MKQKSLYTVKQATEMAFQRMPLDFDAIRLVDTARRIMARPHCFDGTILRRLREIRDENPEYYNYKVVDTETGKYQKLSKAKIKQTPKPVEA